MILNTNVVYCLYVASRWSSCRLCAMIVADVYKSTRSTWTRLVRTNLASPPRPARIRESRPCSSEGNIRDSFLMAIRS